MVGRDDGSGRKFIQSKPVTGSKELLIYPPPLLVMYLHQVKLLHPTIINATLPFDLNDCKRQTTHQCSDILAIETLQSPCY